VKAFTANDLPQSPAEPRHADSTFRDSHVGIRFADIEKGAAVRFVTGGDAIPILRERVREIMRRYDQVLRDRAAGTPTAACPYGTMPEAALSVADIEGGAELRFDVLQEADIFALRAHVRAHAGHMLGGFCPQKSTRTVGAATPD
jgi:hypothetical protein